MRDTSVFWVIAFLLLVGFLWVTASLDSTNHELHNIADEIYAARSR